MFRKKKKKYKVFEVPVNLECISFLRDHYPILKRIDELSRDGIKAVIDDNWCNANCGGFDWKNTEEGDVFWYAVLINKDTNTFYKKYPKEIRNMK